MSMTYTCQLSETVTRGFTAENEMKHRIELTEILDEESMKDLLRKALQKEGWDELEDGTFQTSGDNGETLIWDVDEGEVTARLEEEGQVSRTISVTGTAYDHESRAKEHAQQLLEGQRHTVSAEAEDVRVDVEAEMERKLQENEEARKEKLNAAIREAYGSALRQKASGLGTIVSEKENDTDSQYDLTIRVAQ
jgi:hypothetical protein